jgi:hypothetical protein
MIIKKMAALLWAAFEFSFQWNTKTILLGLPRRDELTPCALLWKSLREY